MVGANTFREPALTAKMATTLDHISGGRAILGIGGAWFETEHEAFGLAFGDGFPERLRWLGEALPIMRGMLHGERPTAAGPRYSDERRPQPAAAHPGAAADPHRRRRRAGHAQARGPIRRRQQRGRRHRQRPAQGSRSCSSTARRSDATRPRSSGRPASGRSSSATRARRPSASSARCSRRNGNAELWKDQPVGTVEEIVERLAPFVELGYRHLIAGFPGPHDEESMTRLADRGPAAPGATLAARTTPGGQAWSGTRVSGLSVVLALARWRAAFARLPQVVMSHQRRRPDREPS